MKAPHLLAQAGSPLRLGRQSDPDNSHPEIYREGRCGVNLYRNASLNANPMSPPTDALTVRSWWPYARVIGCPGVNGWNARATAGLVVANIGLAFVAADNDDAGRRWLTSMTEALNPHMVDVVRVPIPDDHNDLGDWHTSAGADFPAVFSRALKRAAGRLVGTPPRIAPLLGPLRSEALDALGVAA